MSSSTVKQGFDKQDWAEAKAKDAASSVGEMASHAATAVGAMATQAARDASVLANQAVREVGKRADELTASAGAGIQGLGDRLHRNAPEAGAFRNASEMVAGAVKEGGEYLQQAKLTGITEDVAHVIRRNPIPSVLIAIGLGWFLGRKLRG